jgi:ABC-type antimicrobial peptide transport system permease subunit
MMPDRKMFWRIIGRLLTANRGRFFVILLALGAGATITAALLNLQVDAKRRLSSEFRTLGANVVVAPRNPTSLSSGTLDESIANQIPRQSEGGTVGAVSFLYVVASASVEQQPKHSQAVVAGIRGDALSLVAPFQETSHAASTDGYSSCAVGTEIARQLQANIPARLVLQVEGESVSCHVASVLSFGGSEDNQIFLPDMAAAQRLARLPGRISLIQLSVPGTPQSIARYIDTLAQRIPDADVHGIRQFTEGEARIYNRISGILSATVALVLVLTGLCVMAAMTNVAMERRNDVGLMKAIGGATRRVLRLFLAEAAILGLTGGIIGAAIGILLSMWLGKAVFGIAARPRLIVYPVAVALTIIVAIAGAYPLRRLANIRPAAVFRGEA